MIAWIGTALAQCPTALSEFDVRALVNQSSDAIFDDDVLAHKRIFTDLVQQVPCLDAPVPKDVWAELLVNEAIVRFVAKTDWAEPLTTALRLVPDLEGVPRYLLDALPRPAPVAYAPVEVPEDVALFVDGQLVDRVPRAPGGHVVQRWRDRELVSLWIEDVDERSIPADWLTPEAPVVVEVAPPDLRWRPIGRGAVGIGLGPLVASQLVEGEGTWLADDSQVGLTTAVFARGFQPIARYGGVFGDGAVGIVGPSVRRSAGQPSIGGAPVGLGRVYAGPAVVLRRVAVGLGGGVFQLQKVEGGVPITITFPQAHAALSIREAQATFELGGGLSPSAGHALARAGWIVAEAGQASLRIGFDAHLGIAWFTEERAGSEVTATEPRAAQAVQLGAIAAFEIGWGREPRSIADVTYDAPHSSPALRDRPPPVARSFFDVSR